MKDKNITEWNGYVEFELDRLGIPKIVESYIIVNETITEKYNTTKSVLKNDTTEEVQGDKKNEEFEIN